jgi:predicted ATP-grasp superfamily ATP-dependent carboligase
MSDSRLRVFVYEYVCAGAGQDALTEQLRIEGRAMLAAALADWQRLPGVETSTLWDVACEPAVQATVIGRSLKNEEKTAFQALARAADYSLIIAPECDDILARRCAWVEEVDGRLLGCSRSAVRLTGDKLALSKHLTGRGVRTPRCVPYVPREKPAIEFPAIWKPRDGVGSSATFLVHNWDECQRLPQRARAEGWAGEAIVQTFMPGQPASVAVLVGPRHLVALPPAEQHLSADGRFHYLGGQVPLPPELAERAQRLARQAVSVVPGLRGYVGVDLALGDAADGSADWVIEINPRLTTSYVGLRALAETNLMKALLDVVEEREPALAWREETVVFRANGDVLSRPAIDSRGR